MYGSRAREYTGKVAATSADITPPVTQTLENLDSEMGDILSRNS